MAIKQHTVYFDGRSKLGCCIDSEGLYKKVMIPDYLPQTSNTGEYFGLLCALQMWRLFRWPNTIIYGDSEVVINQIKGSFRTNQQHLKVLKSLALDILRDTIEKFNIKEPQLVWIPGKQNLADAVSRKNHYTLSDFSKNDFYKIKKQA